jgi:flavin-dependent dehydrogenase
MPFTKRLKPYLDRLIPCYCPEEYDIKIFRGALMRIRSHRDARIIAGGALLVGEAAGLVNAFTGEGIYYAIKSAGLAAPAILNYLKGETNFNEYVEAIDREMSAELGLSYTMARVASNNAIGNSQFFFNSFISSRKLWQLLSEVLRGELTYTEFRKRHVELQPLLSLLQG